MKRVFVIEWDDELGTAWMNKWNLETCLNTKEHCGEGLILDVKDITEELWRLNTIKKMILKRKRSVKK